MWKDTEKAPVWEFLAWVLLISVLSTAILFFLEPYSILYAEEGKQTAGYAMYAMIGMVFSTPAPMLATYIVLKRHKKISSLKSFFKLIFHAPSIGRTILITAAFCAAALCVAFLYGIPTGSPLYLLFAALPVLVIGGGVEEIGWRGFLQPALEKRFSFPIATVIVSAIWYTWHLPIWLFPTSNHYGDSLIGFAITIFVWSFALAAIYKATKSVFACVMYHAFVNAVGVVYDWNALFDAYPNKLGMYVYYGFLLAASAIIWVFASIRESTSDKQVSKSG